MFHFPLPDFFFPLSSSLGRPKFFESCVSGPLTPLSGTGGEDPTWQNYNSDYPAFGGVAGDMCAIWSVQGEVAAIS